MSLSAPQGTQSVVPALAEASEPAWVRDGSRAVGRAYQEGVGFEELLLEKLTQSLAGTAGLSGEGNEGAEESGASGEEAGGEAGALGAGGSGLLSSQLPHILAESVASAGGLGLADQLAGELAGPSAAPEAGGTAPGGRAPSLGTG